MGRNEAGEALLRLLELKLILRTGWTRHLCPSQVESVADHSYGVALLAWLLCPPELDRARVLELALVHDLAEVVTGDLTPADGVPGDVKEPAERKALAELLSLFSLRSRALELLDDYQSAASPEARFVKAVDKLEMSLQSVLYERCHGANLSEFRDSARARLQEAGLLDWVPGI